MIRGVLLVALAMGTPAFAQTVPQSESACAPSKEAAFGSAKKMDVSYDLKPAAQDSLKQLGSILRAYPGHSIVIEGHTDNVGTAASNQVLSAWR